MKYMMAGIGWIIMIVMATSAVASDEQASSSPFTIFPVSQGWGFSIMETMTCPAHNYGPPEQALERMKHTVNNLSDDEAFMLWVCRANLIGTLEMFAPHTDQATINPFVYLQHNAPEDDHGIWPGTDHPVINHIREARRAAGSTSLFACIDLRGEPRYFENRHASFEEMEWNIFALVGAHYQGLVWRYRPSNRDRVPWNDRLTRLEGELRAEAENLGNADVVDWIHESPDVPATSLASPDHLYIVLLNPAYMQWMPEREQFRLPFEQRHLEMTVSVELPEDVDVSSIRTLNGLPVPYEQEGAIVQVEHHLSGGGTMLVANLREADIDSP